MKYLLAIIDRLLALYQEWAAKREQKDVQQESEQIEAAPADWFEQHFDSLHDYHAKAVSPQTDPQHPKG
jgi:hypothetical protein